MSLSLYPVLKELIYKIYIQYESCKPPIQQLETENPSKKKKSEVEVDSTDSLCQIKYVPIR